MATNPTIVRCLGPNPHGYLPGGLYLVEHGPLPREIQKLFEPAALPVGARPATIDARAVVRDLEAEARRRKPAPAPAPPLTREDICKKFRWTDEQFVEAKALGFPEGRLVLRSHTMSLTQTVTHTWLAHEVDRWAARVRFIAGAIV